MTIEAIPVEGWEFNGWTGDTSGEDNPIKVTINGDKEITANFEEMDDQ